MLAYVLYNAHDIVLDIVHLMYMCFSSLPPSAVSDMVLYIADIACSLRSFLEVYPPSVSLAVECGLLERWVHLHVLASAVSTWVWYIYCMCVLCVYSCINLGLVYLLYVCSVCVQAGGVL